MDAAGVMLPCAEQQRLWHDLGALDALDALDAAPALAARLRRFLLTLAGQGLDGLALSRLVSQCNDRLSQRLIALTARRHRLPPVEWCWLALGSEGRFEQTFVTDQDNGLVFNASDDREAEALRALFLPFAVEVNQRLADCGFTLCSGQIMAGNPDCCLSFDEWRERFIEWVRRPDPLALLNATIFFDLRPLFGACEFGERLRSLILDLTADTPAFQHLMAANALQVHVPLNFRGEVANGEGGRLDLKKAGTRLFVDAARIFALAAGSRAVNTGDRLRATAAKVGLAPREVAGIEAAFAHLLRLRLAQQAAAGDGPPAGLDPASLHAVDAVILREALHQARRLQQRLKLNYAL